MKIWSSLGWIEEVESKAKIKDIIAEKVAEYENQKITLSKMVDGEQVNEVLYNGTDEEKKAGWLDMIRRARELKKQH